MKYLMLMFIPLIIGVACQYSNAGPADFYNDFIGTFTFIENAKEVPFLKIEKQDKAYLASEWSESEKKWSELFPLKNAEKILSRKPEFKGVLGFQAGMGLIVKVPVGWKYGEFTAKTGFAFVSDYPRKGGTDLSQSKDVNTVVNASVRCESMNIVDQDGKWKFFELLDVLSRTPISKEDVDKIVSEKSAKKWFSSISVDTNPSSIGEPRFPIGTELLTLQKDLVASDFITATDVKSKYGKLGVEEKPVVNGRMQIEYPIDGGNIFFYFSRPDEQKIGSLEYVELGFWKSPPLRE